ncbi:MAG: AMP-dependent synthetase/ligase [Myxococcota bacterium]|nr:AMP-dependent synthetase/ligase [Myxococcota bacterium]
MTERPASSLCEAFQRTAAAHADAVALRTAGGGVEIPWREYARRVERIAGGLEALGVQRGEAVGLMMVNRPEFHLADTAALHLGATPFSIYNTSAPEQVAYLFGSAGNRVVLCDEAFAPRVLEAKADTGVEHVVCVDGRPDGTISLDELEAARRPDFDAEAFEARWREVDGSDVATLIYTSGTTGPPKGVELTHANLLAQLDALLPLTGAPGPGDRAVSFLPAAHVADRVLSHYAGMATGLQVTSLADAKQLMQAVVETRPTIFGGVPRVWEKVMAGLQAAGITDPSSLPEEARRAVLAKAGLDAVRTCVCGAAPIPTEVLDYFIALGLRVQEVWGMSELSAVATINPSDAIRVGTVGRPLPGVEVALAEDGELLCRGPIVMRGYRNQPDKTAETIDGDGWLHTGDIAEIDADGYVRIVDRKKELLINAAGKNMSPANIEQKLKAASPLIGQAVAIGDGRRYNVALLVLDPDAGAAWAASHGLDDASPAALCRDPGVGAAVAEAVEAANARMSRVEQIKRYTILPCDWEPGGDELTPTSKLRRKPIAQKYAAEIEALYAEGPA